MQLIKMSNVFNTNRTIITNVLHLINGFKLLCYYLFVIFYMLDLNQIVVTAIDLDANSNNNIKIDSNNFIINDNQEQQQIVTVKTSKNYDSSNTDEIVDTTEEQWNKYTPGDVRCYCNLPRCVSTGYMCKSTQGGCFTDLLGGASDVFNARHGCLEYFSNSELREQCQAESSTGGWSRPQHPSATLLCCFKDMCNHVDSPEARSKLNDTLMNSTLISNLLEAGNTVPNTNIHPTPSYSDAEVWFKAATIAVPICGALILFMLIGLAVKILRSDANKLGGPLVPSMEYKSTVNHFNSGHNASNCVKKVPFMYSADAKNFKSQSMACCHNVEHIAPLLIQSSNSPINCTSYEQKNEMLAKFNTVKNVNIPTTPHVKIYEKTVVPLNQ